MQIIQFHLSICMSVYTWNKLRPTGWIVMKFDSREIYEPCWTIRFSFQLDSFNTHLTWRHILISEHILSVNHEIVTVKIVLNKLFRENRDKYYTLSTLHPKSYGFDINKPNTMHTFKKFCTWQSSRSSGHEIMYDNRCSMYIYNLFS